MSEEICNMLPGRADVQVDIHISVPSQCTTKATQQGNFVKDLASIGM